MNSAGRFDPGKDAVRSNIGRYSRSVGMFEEDTIKKVKYTVLVRVMGGDVAR